MEPWGRTYGARSPMVKAYLHPRGKLLMLGVDYHSSTYCHLVEVVYWNRCLRQNPEASYRWARREDLGARWDSLGRLRKGKVGSADCRLFRIRDFVDTLLDAVISCPDRWLK